MTLIFTGITSIFSSMFKSSRKGIFTILIIASIFLLINDLKYIIMLNPVALSDVHFLNTSNIGTAGLYLKTVNGSWIIKTIIKFLIMIFISFGALKMLKKDKEEYLLKTRLIGFFLPIILIGLFFIVSTKNSLFMVKHIYNYDFEKVLSTSDYGKVYYEEGLYQGIIYNHYASNVHRPDDYNKEKAIKLLDNMKKDPNYNGSFGKPNIVIILSESFSDITNIDEVTFDQDILSNIHSLEKQSDAVVTNTHVSTFGGSSVISEWEILTSSSNNFNPAGYISYTAYYKDKRINNIKKSPNIIRLLDDEGYITKYITPWAGESYNSSKVYKMLGATDIKYDLKGEKKGFYVSDESINRSIISELKKNTDKPKLLVYATSENHMPCSEDKFDKYDISVKSSKLSKADTKLLKCYAQGVYDADKALGELYNQVKELDQNTIVIFYGDHLPFITNDAGENAYLLPKYFNTRNKDINDLRKYTTKGVIFSNYLTNLDQSINYINLNYLSAYVFANLDIKNNEYFKYVDSLKNDIPVFSKTYTYENNQIIPYKNMDKEKLKKLREFRNVQYYSFYDNLK